MQLQQRWFWLEKKGWGIGVSLSKSAIGCFVPPWWCRACHLYNGGCRLHHLSIQRSQSYHISWYSKRFQRPCCSLFKYLVDPSAEDILLHPSVFSRSLNHSRLGTSNPPGLYNILKKISVELNKLWYSNGQINAVPSIVNSVRFAFSLHTYTTNRVRNYNITKKLHIVKAEITKNIKYTGMLKLML